jgi:hypothetical protein
MTNHTEPQANKKQRKENRSQGRVRGKRKKKEAQSKMLTDTTILQSSKISVGIILV